MKTLKSFTSLILLFLLGLTVTARVNTEEKLNLPGDNLNLYAVMDLFRESETLEGFEQNLNAEDSKINNLDLNNDGKVDYIKVIDYVDGEVHTIVLQVAVTEKENQDVAVFTVQKDNNNQVQVQLIGDKELYGNDYIIEPIYDDATAVSTPNPGYAGNTNTVQVEKVVVTKTTYVEVASWPVIRYIYVPTYVAWHSPWYWGYYPSYWRPWSPYYWDYYYGYHSHYYTHYYGYYHHSHHYRYPYYSDHYYNRYRSYSHTVNHHRQSGVYKNTYSHPETRAQGSADFKRKYPDGYNPATKSGTSSSANRPTAKPGVNQSSNRPDATNPTSRPGTTKPSTRPATTNPSTKSGSSNPTTRLASTTPSAKPSSSNSNRPTVTKPANIPGVSKPTTKPSNPRPSINSGANKPEARPANTSAKPKQSVDKPATRPSSNTKDSKSSTKNTSTDTKKSKSSSSSERPVK